MKRFLLEIKIDQYSNNTPQIPSMSMGGVQHSRLRTVRDAGARRRRCPDDKVLILLIILLTEALPCLDAFRLPPPALSLREVLAETSRRPPASSTARRLHRCLVFSKHLLGPRSQRERVVLQGALASKTGASSMTCSFQTFFGDFTVRTFSDADESCFDNVAADIVAPIKVCRASGGEVLCVIRHGDEQSRPLAAASARVLGESAVLETIILADDECEGVERELQTFLVRCLEAVCRHRGSVAHVRVLAATEPRVDADALLQGGYMRDGDGTLQKALSEANGVSASREGEKGSKELLGVVDVEGREIAVLPRAHVERFNLLIPAIGVLVHNAQGQVAQRHTVSRSHAPSLNDLAASFIMPRVSRMAR
jgi:hypothetical protein